MLEMMWHGTVTVLAAAPLSHLKRLEGTVYVLDGGQLPAEPICEAGLIHTPQTGHQRGSGLMSHDWRGAQAGRA